MKFFHLLLLFPLIISCSLFQEEEEEEFDYYEPIIGEEFQTISDPDNRVEYAYDPQQELYIETEDVNGIKYSIKIPASALQPGYDNLYNGYIAPLLDIQNLPEEAHFEFGLEIEPYGVRFTKPVEIIITLPGNFDTQNLRGFYNEGLGGMAYLEPLKIKRASGKTLAIFEVLHFSSYGGITVENNDFGCPDPRSAQSCDNLREIVGCVLGSYEVGINEELRQSDKDAVNRVLRSWMEEQLRYAGSTTDFDFTDRSEFQYELSQYLCWKAMTQEFNADPESVFSDLFHQAEEYIVGGFADAMSELDQMCSAGMASDPCMNGLAYEYTREYLQWYVIAQQLGIEDEPGIIGLSDFCDNSLNNFLINFSMVKEGTLEEFPKDSISWAYSAYKLELGNSDQVLYFDYYMTNLLYDLVQVDQSEITWIDVSRWGEDQKNAFIYENGSLYLNKIHEMVYYMINSTDPMRPYRIGGEFEIYWNGCYVSQVNVIWSRL